MDPKDRQPQDRQPQDHQPQDGNVTAVSASGPLPPASSSHVATAGPANSSDSKPQSPTVAPPSALNPLAQTSPLPAAAVNNNNPSAANNSNPSPPASSHATAVPSVTSTTPQKQSSTLAVPERASSTKMTEPSPTSTATTAAVQGDTASTASKRKRRRKDDESSTNNTKDAGRPQKGGIGRLFTVFLCCRKKTDEDEAHPAPRAASQKRESTPTRKATPPLGKEQATKGTQKDNDVGTSKDAIETEKAQVETKKEATPIFVAAAKTAAPPVDVDKKFDDPEKSEQSVPSAGPVTSEKTAEKVADVPTQAAPITGTLQSPTATVSRSDDIGALPEAPFPPEPTRSGEGDLTDTDIDEAAGDVRVQRVDEAMQIPLPLAASGDQEDAQSTAGTTDKVEPLITHEGASGESPSVKEKQQWLLPPMTSEFEGKKCLVLDLDETLVHSSFKLLHQADFTIPVDIEGTYHNVYVIKRPGVDQFMKRVGELYEVVVFTASVSKYGDPLLDQLDINKVVHHRLFRDSCFNHHGNYVKDLSQLGRNLKDTIIIDNSPTSYIFHPQHAVPISSWFSDAHDNELLDLIPVLEDLSSTNVQDVGLVLDVSL